MNLEDLFSDAGSAPSPLREIDAWTGEVLLLRSDAIVNPDSPAASGRRLDHVFGAYKARDRLARAARSFDLAVIEAVDALFVSFTSEVGRDWVDLTGMRHRAGEGWWWERLPVSGPARDDYESCAPKPKPETTSAD